MLRRSGAKMQSLPIKPSRIGASVCLLLFALLTGCASLREVPATVQSYSSLSEPLEASSYRLEQLPSQQHEKGQAADIFAEAEQALSAAGLQRDDEKGRWIVQVNTDAEATYETPWPRYYSAYSPWWGYAPYGFGPMWGPFYWDMPPARQIYRRSVHLLLRDSTNGQLVYETSAQYRGALTNDLGVFAVLFKAALQDFPHARQDRHIVRLPLPKHSQRSAQ